MKIRTSIACRYECNACSTYLICKSRQGHNSPHQFIVIAHGTIWFSMTLGTSTATKLVLNIAEKQIGSGLCTITDG